MPILFGVIIAAAVLVGWLTVTMRPSAARANLFAELPVEARASESGVRSLGAKVRRFVPIGLVKTMEPTCPGRPPLRDGRAEAAGHPGRAHGGSRRCSASSSGSPLVAHPRRRSVGFFAPRFWISNQRTKRQEAITAAVSDTIDQLTICVESGMGFDAALLTSGVDERRAARPRSSSTPSATCEPASPGSGAAGPGRPDAAPRDQDARAGAHPGAAPRHAAGRHPAGPGRRDPGERRKQAIEEKAAKLGTKMIFPTVLLFFPVIFVVLLAPSFVSLMQTFGG